MFETTVLLFFPNVSHKTEYPYVGHYPSVFFRVKLIHLQYVSQDEFCVNAVNSDKSS